MTAFEQYRADVRASGAPAFWCEPEDPADGAGFWWPFCEIPGCINGICFGKGETRFCWPHSGSGTTVAAIIEEHAREPA